MADNIPDMNNDPKVREGIETFRNVLRAAMKDFLDSEEYKRRRKQGQTLAKILEEPGDALQQRADETETQFKERIYRLEGHLKTEIYDELRNMGYTANDIDTMRKKEISCNERHYDPEAKLKAQTFLQDANLLQLNESYRPPHDLDPKAPLKRAILDSFGTSCVKV